ncbi:hypothetical protein SEA_LEOPARD_78 [Mycobacterium phage Leopard]|nr:hypothetical protein SEA_LEOPARD_78 [Mycobacterium phage Leopard]
MTRLASAHVKTLEWTEDEYGICAEGHQTYEIDENNEVAVFRGEKCVRIVKAADLPHAVSIVVASEQVCAYHLRNGRDLDGKRPK